MPAARFRRKTLPIGDGEAVLLRECRGCPGGGVGSSGLLVRSVALLVKASVAAVGTEDRPGGNAGGLQDRSAWR